MLAPGQAQLWGSRYNLKMTDLTALQEELATEISEQLRLQLTGEEKKRLRKRPTQNNEAFRLLLQAQHYLGGFSPDGIRKGIALCQQAIEIDPAYGAAYARLSLAYSLMGVVSYMGVFGTDVQNMAFFQTKAAADRALELDDTVAEAHVGLGWWRFYRGWDFPGAHREAQRALALDPNSAEAWALLDFVALSLGRFDDAIAAGKRAAELAPLYGFASFVFGVTYYHAQQFDKAIAQMRKTLEIESGSALYHAVLAQAYAAAGQDQNAREECDVALALSRNDNSLVLHTVVGYAMLGDEKAHRLVEQVEKQWAPDGVSAFWIACVHACLDEKDAAFAWLEKAFQEHAAFVVWTKVFYPLARLRGDPRFDSLVKRIGVPD